MLAIILAISTQLTGLAYAQVSDTPTQATKPARGGPVDEARTAVLPLKHTDAASIATVLASISGGQVMADARTNSLIFRGSETAFRQFQDVVKSLDLPATEPAGDEISTIPVRNRVAQEIAVQLVELIGRAPEYRDVRVASDNVRGILLINGPKTFLDAARMVAETLDTPAQRVPLEFAVLYASTSKSSDGEPGRLHTLSSPMPPDLQDVAKDLQRFGDMRLLARLTTVAVENDEFSVEGMIAGEMRVSVRGKIQQANPDGAVRLWIGADAVSTEKAPTRFQLQTTVTAPRGDTVVLGTAPSGWKAGESAVLVVRIGK